MDKYHKSVLLSEVVGFLSIKPHKRYIDATLGGGGHSEAILEAGGDVLGIDRDKEALEHVRSRIKRKNFRLTQGNFADLDKIARLQGFSRVAGVIFDLGVSSRQINEARRGFSFQKEGPLDMRMSQDEKLPKAKDILNLASKDELYKIFSEFGEDSRAWALASAVGRAREIKAFETTGDLLKVIEEVYGIQGLVSGKTLAGIAKKPFQALRIAVNSELESLEEALPKAVELLEKGGRILIISFHSLEDRLVKQAFSDFEKQGLGRIITKKPVLPSLAEQRGNPRSRSAKLRVFERN